MIIVDVDSRVNNKEFNWIELNYKPEGLWLGPDEEFSRWLWRLLSF
jgi:hypothetical protein